ncbi:MAG TPA: 50S ribosomal protein L2 [bacterium]|jgi:large subunit ribosomal protein L2|nr:50S ribosomal protein L2 [bacterium]
MITKKQIRVSKPTTPALRKTSYALGEKLSKTRPIKSLTTGFQRAVGRDKSGRISARHKGGGAKRLYRKISTLELCGVAPFEVLRFEYDPNRSAHIALIKNSEGKLFYILAPIETKVGHKLEVGEKAPVAPGNRLPIANIPTGLAVHSLEITPGSRGKTVRSAGAKAIIMAHEGDYALVKLPSGEIRRFHGKCLASVGVLSNDAHNAIRVGKAGRKRHMGIRPTVRGLAMHPAAHPHGGGENSPSIGMKAPKTPWGAKALGKKTRRRFDRGAFIVRRRAKKRR